MRLFTRKHTLEDSGFFRNFTDWHCHLLPGVDDGVQTIDESLRILEEYERLGVREVWLTPHVMEDIPNTTEHLRERFSELQAVYTGKVKLNLAAEHMLDNLFEERLERNDLLPLGKEGRHLLVETSYFNPPMDLHDILQRIQAQGYYPVLAHPERYLYMDEVEYRHLKSMGIRFQLNRFSLFGMYGKEAQKKARWLQKENMYDYIGTDLHRLEVLERMLRERG